MVKPIAREEKILNAIANAESFEFKPITREEMYLAYLAGVGEKPQTPITRKEMFLDKIELGNTGGGGATIKNQDITITENGTYTADDGYTGLGTVEVNVESIGGGDIDALIDKSITEVSSNATSIGNSAFHSCSELLTADFPVATSIGEAAFGVCSKLTTADFPLVTSIGNYAFQSCRALSTVDFPLATSIGNRAFYDCSKLTAVILRNEEEMVTLANVNAFTHTPIANGTGYFYVPRVYLDDTDSTKDYRQATNFSTYSAQFRALEDFTIDGTVSGELDWDKINATA